MEPVRNYDYFDLNDNGNLAFTFEKDVKDLGNISKCLYSPSRIINELGILYSIRL